MDPETDMDAPRIGRCSADGADGDIIIHIYPYMMSLRLKMTVTKSLPIR